MYRSRMLHLLDDTWWNDESPYGELLQRMDEAVDEEVSECAADAWDEDHVTRCILKRIRKDFASCSLSVGSGDDAHLKWTAFKARRGIETNHGDIAVLVRFEMDGGKVIVGVGFLEAKRAEVASGKFKAVRNEQTNRILENTHHPHLLLYDLRPVAQETERDHWGGRHTSVVQMSLAKAVNDYARGLHLHGVSFATHLLSRYLSGLDLDYREEVVQNVIDNKESFGLGYLLVGTVSQGPEDEDVPGGGGGGPVDGDDVWVAIEAVDEAGNIDEAVVLQLRRVRQRQQLLRALRDLDWDYLADDDDPPEPPDFRNLDGAG